ncbi:hypothetical protein QFC22_004690 [Naganishia vaughanmartiniae]|uniref:Uncharacterized protein n=1 Tax=Naganishia vaughanmartiniae TaxID=1424756 RepID=A0ACC2X0V7_9TREE|nr:hypothetical protein QFC22_004690 [Naganishia vaughanmartiniae]
MDRSVPAAQQVVNGPAIWTLEIDSSWNKLTKELKKVVEQCELGECEAFISTFIIVGQVFKAIAKEQPQLIPGAEDNSGAEWMKQLMKRILGDAYELVHSGSVQRAFADLASKLFPPETVYCGRDASNLQLLGILSSSENVSQFFMHPILLGTCDAEYKAFLKGRASSNAKKIAAAYAQARLQWDNMSSKLGKLSSTPLTLLRLGGPQQWLADPFSSISWELQSADTAATAASSHHTFSQVDAETLHSEIAIDPALSQSYSPESQKPDTVEARSQLRRTWVELEHLLSTMPSTRLIEEQNTPHVSGQDILAR